MRSLPCGRTPRASPSLRKLSVWRMLRRMLERRHRDVLDARPNNAALGQEVKLIAAGRSTEKAELLGSDQRQTEQPDPRAREGRAASRDSQAGAEGRRKADRDQNADRLKPARRLPKQHVFRAGSERSATLENRGEAGDYPESSREVDRDERGECSGLAGRQNAQQEPHAEDGRESHQSEHGQESQLRASRLALGPVTNCRRPRCR